MRADINTIARECCVSKATVSRVFTGNASVSALVKERILTVARELNYTPQKLVAKDVIAIIVSSLDATENFDGFRTILLINLVAEITRSGYLVNVLEVKDSGKLLGSFTKVAIVMMDELEISGYEEELSKMKIPLISIGSQIDNCHYINFNYEEEIATAVEYLVKNGHKKISLFLDNSTIRAGKERFVGYVNTMKKHDIDAMPLYDYYPDKQSLIEVMGKMLQDKPTAMIICGESLPNEAVYALNLLRVKIPDDLSVISFEKRDSSRWFSPPHTTIDQNISQMVKGSIAMIKKVMNSSSAEKLSKILTCKLKIRDSVKKIASN